MSSSVSNYRTNTKTRSFTLHYKVSSPWHSAFGFPPSHWQAFHTPISDLMFCHMGGKKRETYPMDYQFKDMIQSYWYCLIARTCSIAIFSKSSVTRFLCLQPEFVFKLSWLFPYTIKVPFFLKFKKKGEEMKLGFDTQQNTR